MAVLPSYVTILFQDLAEGFEPGVEEFKPERGLSKLRVTSSRVVVSVSVRLRTFSREDSLALDAWYFDVIKRIGWFDWFDTRSKTTRSVRFKGGALGDAVPLRVGYEIADRRATLEFLR